MAIVFVSDTHLYPYIWASMPHVRGDSYRSFEQVIRFCSDKRDTVKALIIGGDTFDSVPTPDAVDVFLRGVDKLRQCGIKVLAIQGQHGRYREFSWTSIDPYVVDLEKQGPVDIGGKLVAGFDNRPPDDLKACLAKLPPKVDYLVLHQLIQGAVPVDVDGASWDLDPDWVPTTVKLVLMGDYHGLWSKERKNPNGSMTTFVYNGSTHMRSISENTDKRFTLVDETTDSIAQLPLKTRPFKLFMFQTKDIMSAALAQIKEIEPDSLVLIKYDPRVEAVEQTLLKTNDRVHYLFRPMVLETEVVKDLVPELGQVSLESCLDLLVKRDDPLHSFTLDLLRSKDINSTLDETRKRLVNA